MISLRQLLALQPPHPKSEINLPVFMQRLVHAPRRCVHPCLRACPADITAEVSITITGASPTHKDEGLSFLSTSATCGEELPSELFERVPELREEGDGILVFA